MANEAKNVSVADRSPPDRQPPSVTKTGEANPYIDPVDYLKSKGWKCLGDPSWQSALWLDPTQPLTAHYTKEPIMVPTMVKTPYRDRDGREQTRYVEQLQQVMAQDGSGGAPVQAWRHVFHPKGVPVLMSHALSAQLERDAIETQKKLAEEERRKGAA